MSAPVLVVVPRSINDAPVATLCLIAPVIGLMHWLVAQISDRLGMKSQR
jgi:hypothetical protein